MTVTESFADVTAAAMRGAAIDIPNHPFTREILATILAYVGSKRGQGITSASIALANIRAMTTERLGFDHPLTKEQWNRVNHRPNKARWSTDTMLACIRGLCEGQLRQRGFAAELVRKTKRADPAYYTNAPTYWVLTISW